MAAHGCIESLVVVVERIRATKMASLLSLQSLGSHGCSTINRIFDGCKVGILELMANERFCSIHDGLYILIIVDIAFELVAKLVGSKLGVLHR